MKAIVFTLLLSVSVSAQQLQPLPDAPRRVADKKFLALAAFQATASVLDVESTVGMQESGRCVEGWSAWLVGKRPHRATLYSTAAIGNLATATVAYYLKKKGKNYWWVPQASAGSVHSFAATRNRFMLGCF